MRVRLFANRLVPAGLAVAALWFVQCAPLHPSDLPQACQKSYSSCLNGCANTSPTPVTVDRQELQPTGQINERQPNSMTQASVANCTNRCNRKANACADREKRKPPES